MTYSFSKPWVNDYIQKTLTGVREMLSRKGVYWCTSKQSVWGSWLSVQGGCWSYWHGDWWRETCPSGGLETLNIWLDITLPSNKLGIQSWDRGSPSCPYFPTSWRFSGWHDSKHTLDILTFKRSFRTLVDTPLSHITLQNSQIICKIKKKLFNKNQSALPEKHKTEVSE